MTISHSKMIPVHGLYVNYNNAEDCENYSIGNKWPYYKTQGDDNKYQITQITYSHDAFGQGGYNIWVAPLDNLSKQVIWKFMLASAVHEVIYARD